jgi:hypothetical protein
MARRAGEDSFKKKEDPSGSLRRAQDGGLFSLHDAPFLGQSERFELLCMGLGLRRNGLTLLEIVESMAKLRKVGGVPSE